MPNHTVTDVIAHSLCESLYSLYCAHCVYRFSGFSMLLFASLSLSARFARTQGTPSEYSMWYCSFSRFFLRARSHVPLYALYNVLPKRFYMDWVRACVCVCVWVVVQCGCCIYIYILLACERASGELVNSFRAAMTFSNAHFIRFVYAEIVRCVVLLLCCC